MEDFLKEPSYPLSALNSLQQVILNKLIKEPLDLGTFNRPQDVLKIIPDKNIKKECDYLANFTKNFSFVAAKISANSHFLVRRITKENPQQHSSLNPCQILPNFKLFLITKTITTR